MVSTQNPRVCASERSHSNTIMRTRASAHRALVVLMDGLPSDALLAILRCMPVTTLCRAAIVCSTWRRAVMVAAEDKLRQHRAGIAPGCDACPCWLRSLWAIELLVSHVGPDPTGRSWRDEYKPLHVAAAKWGMGERWEEWMAADFEPGGTCAEMAADEIDEAQARLGHIGWPAEDAAVLAHIGGEDEAAEQVRSYKQRLPTLAATLHASVRVYSVAACRAAAAAAPVPPPLYYYLSGERSLCHIDPDWAQLPSLPVGAEFRIVGGASARAPLRCYFPDRYAMCKEELRSDDPHWASFEDTYYRYVPQESDVVRFVSRPADVSGYHAMVHDFACERDMDSQELKELAPNFDTDGWSAPLNTTFRLEAVFPPGAWIVRGLRVRRTLYTVTLSFG